MSPTRAADVDVRPNDAPSAAGAGTRPTHSGKAETWDDRVNRYARIGLPIACGACAVALALAVGAGGAILALAGGALLAVILVFWASIRTLFGERPLSGADAYAIAAPRAEEEQKRAVLRALKDLEFERSVGKLSDADYDALVSKYRAEAKRLLQVLEEDAEPRRAKALSLVSKRLQKEGLLDDKPSLKTRTEPSKPSKPESTPERADGDERPSATIETAPPLRRKKDSASDATRACPSCGTMNDEDALFCKRCGAKRAEPRDEAEAQES